MLDSTANQVRNIKKNRSQCPQHDSERGTSTMERGFGETFEGEGVKAAGFFEARKNAFNGRSLGVNWGGGDLHLMPRVGLDDWYRIVFLHNLSVLRRVVPGVCQDSCWWRWEQIKTLSDLVHVGDIGGSDVTRDGQFISGVRDHVRFIPVPPLKLSISAFLSTRPSIRISAFVAGIRGYITAVYRHNFAKVRQYFPQQNSSFSHAFAQDFSVFEFADEPGHCPLGRGTPNDAYQSWVISNSTECSGNRRSIQNKGGNVGAKQDLRTVAWSTTRSLERGQQVVGQQCEYRIQPLDRAKIGLLAHPGWLHWGRSLLPRTGWESVPLYINLYLASYTIRLSKTLVKWHLIITSLGFIIGRGRMQWMTT